MGPLPGAPILLAAALVLAQIPFEQAVGDLASADPATRLRTVRMLKQAAYPDAAIPLASAITDPQDEIQLEAIAAELNIFTAEGIVLKNRRGLGVDRHHAMSAESVFSAGPLAIGTRPVPVEVLTALRSGVYFEDPRVCMEAVYALGVLGAEPGGSERDELLRATGPDLATLAGASSAALRYTAVRVIGRLFARRAGDRPIETTVGDAVVVALNDNDRAVKVAAMQALGAMRYERGAQALTALFRYYGKGEPAEAALDALARIAHPSSAPLLATQLLSTNAALRGIALEGLARLGDPSTLADIHAALYRERNAGVALAGAFALALLGDASTDRVADSLTRPALHEQAKQYLIELAPGRASAFARHLLNPDERIRLDVVDALGLSGDSAAVPVVEPLTKDRDPGVARAAQRAVARLRHAADDRSRSSRSALVHPRARLAHSTVPADRGTRCGPKNRPIVTARRLLIRSAMADFSIPRVNAAAVERHATLASVGEWRHRTQSGETIQVADAVHDLTCAGRPVRFVIAQDVIERAREVEEPREALAGDPHRLEGTETILLVEDEDVVRKFVHKVLSRRGYTVHALTDPRRAVEFGEAHWGAIHLILTDVVLPDMIGPAMSALLARQHPEAKILYMSGYTDGAIVRHGVLDPDMWFLQKPFTAEALAIKVRDLLDLRRLAAR